MGIYVEYRPCEPNGPFSQIINRMEHFAQWYADDFSDDGDPDILDAALALCRGDGTKPSVAPEIMDKLVSEFYGFYCDIERPRPPMPPYLRVGALRIQRYHALFEEMRTHITPKVADLWSMIYNGRPIGPPSRTTPYISDDGASWVSWWTLPEISILRNGLPRADFPTSDYTKSVLEIVHTALKAAENGHHGLVVTAF